MRFLLIYIMLLAFPLFTRAQRLQPGFDKEEYRQLMLVSVRTTASVKYAKGFAEPKYKMIYRSPVIGLDNLWDLWINEKGIAVISIRGTTQQTVSWLANFYAAMLPATGTLQLNEREPFAYSLAQNPRAAVHAGWLLCMAGLVKDIQPRIDSLYAKGIREFLIMGHSQGGGIAFLLTAYVYRLQHLGQLPADIHFKTYCSAGPKPGNLYFAYEYEAATQKGWAYNVVNAADWVPEVPLSVQTTRDFNKTSPFTDTKKLLMKLKFPQNLLARYIFKRMSRPARKAQARYEKYLGRVMSKMVIKNLAGYRPPAYVNDNNYVRAGASIVLLPDSAYYKIYPENNVDLFRHHYHRPYLYLLDKMK